MFCFCFLVCLFVSAELQPGARWSESWTVWSRSQRWHKIWRLLLERRLKIKHQGKPTSTAEFYLGLNRATLNMCWCVVTSIKCLNVTGCNLLYQKKTNLLISTVTGHWLYSHTKVIAIKKLNNDSKILNFVCFGINEKLQVRPTTSGLVGIIQQWLCIGTCDCWLGDL